MRDGPLEWGLESKLKCESQNRNLQARCELENKNLQARMWIGEQEFDHNFNVFLSPFFTVPA